MPLYEMTGQVERVIALMDGLETQLAASHATAPNQFRCFHG